MASLGDPLHSRAYTRFDEAYKSCAANIATTEAIFLGQLQEVESRYQDLTSTLNQETSAHPLSSLLHSLHNLWKKFCAWLCCDRTPPVTQEEVQQARSQWETLQKARAIIEDTRPPQRVNTSRASPVKRAAPPLPTMPPLAPEPPPPAKSSSKIHVGLGNAGNNCWLNAFLQLMRCAPQIKTTYEQIAHALAEDEAIQTKAAQNHIEAWNKKYELEDSQRQDQYARWIPFLAEKRGKAAASVILRSLSQKESFESLFTRRFKHAPSPLPDIPLQAAAGTPEETFTQAFQASLDIILPHVLKEALHYLPKRNPQTLDASFNAICLIALRLAWTYASKQSPSFKERDRRTLVSRIAPDLVSPHMTEFLNENQADLIGPPPSPVPRANIPSLDKAKAQAKAHGEHMLAFLEAYETSLQGRASPLPPRITQEVRQAFYFLDPTSIRPARSQEDAHEFFNILNTTYLALFGEEKAAPSLMNATLHKTYHPIEELPPLAVSDSESFEQRQAASRYYLIDHTDEEIPESINPGNLFTLLEEENTTTKHDPRFDLQFYWEKSTSSKVKLSYEMLARNYFSQQFTVEQKEEEATYMQANGTVRQFVKIEERVTLDAPPEEFLITLKRFERNPRTGALEKKSNPVDMPLQIQLPEEAGAGNSLYRLVSIVNHVSSSIHGGHYISYLHDPETKAWEKADDSAISRCSAKDIETARKVGYLFYYVRERAS